MSATFESNRFAKYFSISVHNEVQNSPVLDIQGRSFTVSEYYLEMLKPLGEIPEIDLNDPKIEPQMYIIVKLLVQQLDNLEIQQYGSETPNGLSAKRGSVLIFLPGLAEINEMDEKLREIMEQFQLKLVPLHSTITTEEQAKVFEIMKGGRRKVIMSTNIAESSITVPDIKYVIDFCLTKNLMCDPETGYSSLQLQWASKANCKQRAGRAGRVSAGRVYRLVTRQFYTQLTEFASPEMQRCPLEICVLKAKMFNIGEPKEVLGKALDPPALDDIESTILMLKEVGALSSKPDDQWNPHDGDLTFLGRVMAALPLDIRYSKLILLGHVFGLLEESIIISASLAEKSFFSSPYKAHLEAYRKRFEWTFDTFSDPLAYLFAYKLWKKRSDDGFFPTQLDEQRWCRQSFIQIRRIKDVQKIVIELMNRLKRFNIAPLTGPNRPIIDIHKPENLLMMKVVLAGAFYPNYFRVDSIDEEQSTRLLGGHDPQSTVMVRGLPSNQGSLYRRNMEDIFTKCDSRAKKPRVHFEETKAYIEFHRDPSLSSKINPAVYMALKMKQIGRGMNMEFAEVDPETARLQLKQMSIIQGNQTSLRTNRISTSGDVTVEEDSLSSQFHQVELPTARITMVNLVPTLIKECGAFWAQFGDKGTVGKVQSLQYTLNLYQGRNLQQLAPTARQVGYMCLAPYADVDGSKEYYRARIEKLDNRTQKAAVFFVDYGNVEHVDFHKLRELESHYNSFPFQAVECHLSGIKPSSIKCPNGQWTKEANEIFKNFMSRSVQCIARIYSIVHGVIRAEVFLKNHPDGEEINLNEKLVTLCYADVTEEDFASKHNHRMREEAAFAPLEERPPSPPVNRRSLPTADLGNFSTQNTVFVRKKGGRIRLAGPIHPYEINFYSMTNIGRMRTCRIDMQSVNCVSLDSEPHIKYSRMMVAGYVGLNPTGSVIQARDTTIMPSIPGLPALITLLFTPRCELRVSPKKKKVPAALCGLGWDDINEGPALGDHDIEIVFDTHVDNNDLSMINVVRTALNMAIGNEEASFMMGQIQSNVRSKFMKWFEKRREPVEPMIFRREYHWNQIEDPDDILQANVPEICNNTLYPLHCAIALACDDDEVDDEEEVNYRGDVGRQQDRENLQDRLEHIQWLHRQADNSNVARMMTCELCDTVVNSPQELLIHLNTTAHTHRERRVLNF